MTENEDGAEVLARSPVFKELPKDARDAIAGAVHSLVVSRNSIVLRQGDPGECLYIIRSGSVRIFRRNEEGMHLDISIKGPGETFGEMALLTGEPRSADVETLGETHLMVLPKDHLDRIMRDFPEISRVFAREMRRWLFNDEKRLEIQAREVHKSLRITWFDYFLIMAVSIVLATIFNYSNPNGISLFSGFLDRSSVPAIGPAAAYEEFQRRETLFLDARPANFYQERRIKGAVNIPLALFDIVYLMTFAKENKEKKIIVYGGTVSKLYDLELADKLLLRGHEQVRILEGGLAAWEGRGYPVEEKGKE
ncbi:MAG TPA: cyclic nucleotide-binding domain-containing protein [Thermodesulfobacteriota bacterium]|nr:cyclic nucleotide-binding domain-containing protein [Thermodesulfobacteriota bacterium]